MHNHQNLNSSPRTPQLSAKTLVKLCAACILTSVVVSGCSMKLPTLKIPRVHKIPVQQGNVITQDMIDRLKPGMSRSQVAYVMGEPVLRNTFDDNRWDYVYSLDIPNVLKQVVRMTLYFEGDSLAYFTGDMAPSSAVEDDVPAEDETDDDTAGVADETLPMAANSDS